ncbi:MAG: hypothetical protein DRP90_00870 [Planctomycetota bacterium]|nr:MAG: hypothetical protein DRP90_00870 [Planctomycetota bacterium]
MSKGGRDTNVYRFGVSMEPALVAELDGYVKRSGFRNRSEAIREIIRGHMAEHRWDDLEGEVAAVLSVFFSRAVPGVEEKLAALRNRFASAVLSGLEIPLRFGSSVLVMGLYGERPTVSRMVDAFRAVDGVEHAEAVLLPRARLGSAPERPRRSGLREYFEREDAHIEPAPEEMALLRSRLQAFPLSGAVALDAGCGTGASTALLLELVSPGGRVIAVDFSSKAVELTRSRVGARAELRRDDLASFSVLPASVDFVLCHDTFGILEDKSAFLRSARRALRPGGRLYVFDWPSPPLPFKAELPAGGRLKRLLCSAGLILEDCERAPVYAFTAHAPGGSGAAREIYGNDTRKKEE